jgi:hypothetical protein
LPEVEHKSINNHHKLTKSIPSKMSFHYPPIELNLKVKCLTVALKRHKLVLSLLLTMMNSVYSYSMSILFQIPIYQIKKKGVCPAVSSGCHPKISHDIWEKKTCFGSFIGVA